MARGRMWSIRNRLPARNPNWCYGYGGATYPTCFPANEYNPQLTKAGLQSFQLSSAMAQLPALTTQVTKNNRFSSTSATGPAMAAVHDGVQHVIYILKENRTYDQILGDLGRGNGDPTLALLGRRSRRISTTWRRSSLPSTISAPPPKSVMTAGRGALRLARPTWSNTSSLSTTRSVASAWILRA